MKITILSGELINGKRKPFASDGSSPVQAELVIETETLSDITNVFTTLVFGEDASTLSREQKRHRVVRFDCADGGHKVAIITQDETGLFWKMVTNISMP